MTDNAFYDLLQACPPSEQIHKYLMVTRHKLHTHRRIAVSYSGGSDSDTILDLIELVKPDDCEIRYVFFDTGLEWDATLRHLDIVEQHYGVTIDRRKAKVSIPAACKTHGVPFISKDFSEKIKNLQQMGFDFSASRNDDGGYKYAVNWFYDDLPLSKNGKVRKTISTERPLLREFMASNPPPFLISDKCCDYAKKNVSHDFTNEYGPDLQINGMRQAEGGRRIGAVKSCFSPPTDKKPAEYRPLWFWSDADKKLYKEWRSLHYSDCYERWGFKRTGCVGCPCASASVRQLEIARPYEPGKVKAAYAVFGESYTYRQGYNEFKRACLAERQRMRRNVPGQLVMEGV